MPPRGLSAVEVGRVRRGNRQSYASSEAVAI